MPRVGLAPASVTEAGAALADEVGFAQLSMGLLAERLGVKTPSLYNHVDSLADLIHRIAVLAATELGDALRDATQGRAGSDALIAAAQAMRTYVTRHPGRYAAGNSVRPNGPDDPLSQAIDRLLASLSAVLRGYQLDPDDQIHAPNEKVNLSMLYRGAEAAALLWTKYAELGRAGLAGKGL